VTCCASAAAATFSGRNRSAKELLRRLHRVTAIRPLSLTEYFRAPVAIVALLTCGKPLDLLGFRDRELMMHRHFRHILAN
jgi:hypothetical protein